STVEPGLFPIQRIPDDVGIHILSFVDGSTLLKFAEVTKPSAALFKQNTFDQIAKLHADRIAKILGVGFVLIRQPASPLEPNREISNIFRKGVARDFEQQFKPIISNWIATLLQVPSKIALVHSIFLKLDHRLSNKFDLIIQNITKDSPGDILPVFFAQCFLNIGLQIQEIAGETENSATTSQSIATTAREESYETKEKVYSFFERALAALLFFKFNSVIEEFIFSLELPREKVKLRIAGKLKAIEKGILDKVSSYLSTVPALKTFSVAIDSQEKYEAFLKLGQIYVSTNQALQTAVQTLWEQARQERAPQNNSLVLGLGL
ncbi:MAG TPA: hypothetical protein VLF61_02010, partial [Rhabdochlamydiaceae bacterium]|nr:hypothetical protein [Rhabdochlamydiaceae bacterium]